MDVHAMARKHRRVRLAARITLVAVALAACGPGERRLGLDGEASAVGTVVQDSNSSARYRLRTTYDGPPLIASENEIIFYIARQASASQATARLDIRLVIGGVTWTGANGYLPPEAGTEPSLVHLADVDWCVQVPCDVTADITIDLLPATGGINPAVEISTVTATSNITYETENPVQSGILDVALISLMGP